MKGDSKEKKKDCIYPLELLYVPRMYIKPLIQWYLPPIIFLIFPLWISTSHLLEISWVDLKLKVSSLAIVFFTPT